MGFFPRSRVYVIVIPVFFFLIVTYPYFRSFSRPDDTPLFDPSYHDRYNHRHGVHQNNYDALSGDVNQVNNIPVLDTELNHAQQPSHGSPPPAAAPNHLDSSGNDLGGNDDSNHPPAPWNTRVVPSGLAPTTTTHDDAEANKEVAPTETPGVRAGKPPNSVAPGSSGPRPFPSQNAFGSHPIDHLVKTGIARQEELRKRETHSLEAAAAAYRDARGRHPPPGFDKWYEFAKEKDALIIEELFDPIYHDTEPFWGRDPASLRAEPATWSNVITIRGGTAYLYNNHGGGLDWGSKWIDMMRSIVNWLPDMDLAFNSYDEPRVIAPWETVNGYMKKACEHKNLDSPDRLVSEYQSLPPLPKLSQDELPQDMEHEWQDWHHMTYWQLAQQACHPEGVAHEAKQDQNFTLPPEFPIGHGDQSHQGYVANYTFSRNACLNPHLRNLHGNFVRPRFASVNATLFPMLGASKHEGISNEIRIPAAKYWSSGALFGGDDDVSTVDADGPKEPGMSKSDMLWSDKASKMYWRGAASGGMHDATNWRHYQRHRFLSMLNSTEVTMTERKLETVTSLSGDDLLNTEPQLPHNFPFPNTRLFPLTALSSNPTKLGEWLEPLTNVSFTHMSCYPQERTMIGPGRRCKYTDPFYSFSEKDPLNEAYKYKFLPDIDGNGYSGRYRAYLRSGSLPIKASVHSEWHDSRLMPWVHFVPMDNTFSDLYGLVEYFAGNPDAKGEGGRTNWFSEWLSWASGGHDGGGRHGHDVTGGGHDHIAQAIAENGREWARKVLRKEDMVVYTHRLLLEWARITNDRRDEMGWAEDLR